MTPKQGFDFKSKTITVTYRQGVWSTNLWMVAGFLLIFSVFIALGIWQLNRAEEKETIALQFSERLHQSPKKHNIQLNDNQKELLFQPSVIEGTWSSNKHYLHDNVTKDGISGFEIISPLQDMNGLIILINRGWLSKEDMNNSTLHISLSPAVVSLKGIWSNPLRRLVLKDLPLQSDFPKVIQQLNFDAIAQDFNSPIFPMQFRLTKSNNHTFNTHWSPILTNPHKHYAYALQWFIFSLILCVLFIRLNYRQNTKIPKHG